MSEPVQLNDVEAMLIRLASAEKTRLIAQAEADFAACIKPVIAQHGLTGTVTFSGLLDGSITMQQAE